MDIIEPGTLCLVIRGRNNVGKTCKVLGLADHAKANMDMIAIAGRPMRLQEHPGDPLLDVDTPMIFVDKSSGRYIGEFPCIYQSFLLPIPPLAEPTEVKQEEEKPCTA